MPGETQGPAPPGLVQRLAERIQGSRGKAVRLAIVQGLALSLMAGAASAAVTLAYTSASTETLGVLAPPVVYAAGVDASGNDYVPSFALSANKTSFTATVRGVPEATVVLSDYVRLKNADSRTHTVTLSTTQVTNALVTAYSLAFYDSSNALVGTLDFKAANPSVTFTDMTAGATYTAKATLTLASGAGTNNVADSRTIQLAVSA
jgi:hypothetical protein